MSAEAPQIITGKTELLGLIAHPIRHSLSPRMHNLALAKLGLDYAYLAFEIDNARLQACIQGFRAMQVRGFNVSMPNKGKVIDYLDEVSDSVALIGACNTVVNEGGRLRGENTDGLGFIKALEREGVGYQGGKMTLLGTGGVATAIAVEAALQGIGSIDIFNRRDAFFAKGEALAERISQHTGIQVSLHDLADGEDFRRSVAQSTLLANGTSVGFKGPTEGLSPLPDAGVLRPDLFVADAIYAPLKTRLLEQAEAAGCRYMNGIPMMIYQGAAAFALWTGREMPIDYIEEHLFASQSRE